MKKFSKKQFFRELIKIKYSLGLGGFEEYKEEAEHPTNEYVYEFKLNRNTNMLIYSTVDKHTDYSREYGKDAVRIVICKDGQYTPYKTLHRSDNLFINLAKHMQKVKDTF